VKGYADSSLLSARHATLGKEDFAEKEAFAMKGYADSSLPSAALGKAFFAECNCTRQSSCLL
jgi:hypothetical protein